MRRTNRLTSMPVMRRMTILIGRQLIDGVREITACVYKHLNISTTKKTAGHARGLLE